MNLQEIAAKLTGLESKFDALKSEAESANTTNAGLTADLEKAAAEHATLSELNAKLTEENAKLTEAAATTLKEQAAAQEKIVTLEQAAQTVKEAASAEAVEIAASQGASAAEAAEAAEAGQTKTAPQLLEEMAKLPIEARHAFYQKNRDVLNPFN
jgi:chromosome segregation ATPase